MSLALDIGEGLLCEYRRTCGDEAIKVLVSRWEGVNGIRKVSPARAIARPISRRLRQLGFGGSVDRLILRIALVTRDHAVASNDGHFWCPGDPKKKGNRNAPVSRLCREYLGIEVMLLSALLARI